MSSTCKKCGNSFVPCKGLKQYCSLKCRNSHHRSIKSKDLVSKAMRRLHNSEEGSLVREEISKRMEREWIFERRENISNTYKEKILSEEYSDLKNDRLKKRIVYEQNGECNKCHLGKWLGEPITLELEHKDGNRQNNERSNLECLCPNCHSQTDTWRGRNSRKKPKKVSDEELIKAILDNQLNFSKALISLNLAPKGGNYKRCYSIIRSIGIDKNSHVAQMVERESDTFKVVGSLPSMTTDKMGV